MIKCKAIADVLKSPKTNGLILVNVQEIVNFLTLI